jgi:hypothetical protein
MTHITAVSQISGRAPSIGTTEHRPNNALRIMREAPIAWSARFRLTFLAILVAVSALFPAARPVWAQESSEQETSEIAKQAQNPIASLISVPFESDFNPHTGINKADSFVLEM